MKYIKGITFAPFAPRGTFEKPETFESLKVMKERTHADSVIFVPCGLQKNAHSEEISFCHDRNVTDAELEKMITYAKELGLRVILKPTVNCMDGTWRAHISFFDLDVPCEPKWGNWFASYTRFQLHYAALAERMGCEMFIAGCEMVMSEHREAEWRKLIADIRGVYTGLVSYNTDKYQENQITWWDAVDVISSSGYYPINDWENQLDRIETVVKKYQKPFFFAESGCMSTAGSNLVPNDWEVKGDIDLAGQADWYAAMTKAIAKHGWVNGMAVWSWHSSLYSKEEAAAHRYYEIYEKPAEAVIREFYR